MGSGYGPACLTTCSPVKKVGWAIDSPMRKSLVHDALKMAEFRNGFSEKRGAKGASTASSFIRTKAASTLRTKHAIICKGWATGNR